jgi:hypothetical protein
MQQRVALSGRPVVEPDRQHSLSGHVLDTAVATADPQVLVQVPNRLDQPSMVGGQHRPAGHRVTQAIEDRHALGRAQHDVERRHRSPAVGAAEELAAIGMAALEHPLEPRWRCFALQA